MDTALSKRRNLRRRRAIASGLLVAAAAVFAAMQFLPQIFAVRLVSAASEAALVGGLADWFAVTALFRRPLGLPIPHTALIPRRKNELGRALGDFVRDNFLAPELVIGRLRSTNRALQAAGWLDSERAADFAAKRTRELVPVLLEHSDDADLRGAIGEIAIEAITRIDLVPVLDAGIEALLRSGKHMLLIDGAAQLLESSLVAIEETVSRKVSEQTGRFFPAYFDRKIGEGVVRGTRNWLADVRRPESQERARLDAWLVDRLNALRSSPGYGRLLDEMRGAIAGNPALRELAVSAWDEVRREIAADLASPEPRIADAVARGVRRAGSMLKASASLQDHVNTALEALVIDYIAPWRAAISDFIAETVERWDTPTIVDLVELEVGTDLQFVRINGTVVGALIGIALYLASFAIHMASQ